MSPHYRAVFRIITCEGNEMFIKSLAVSVLNGAVVLKTRGAASHLSQLVLVMCRSRMSRLVQPALFGER